MRCYTIAQETEAMPRGLLRNCSRNTPYTRERRGCVRDGRIAPVMATTQQTINDAPAALLRKTRRAWRRAGAARGRIRRPEVPIG